MRANLSNFGLRTEITMKTDLAFYEVGIAVLTTSGGRQIEINTSAKTFFTASKVFDLVKILRIKLIRGKHAHCQFLCKHYCSEYISFQSINRCNGYCNKLLNFQKCINDPNLSGLMNATCLFHL